VYLKEVHMENFKSFGHKITVPLLQGYTTITGPNGSGKSNIADAILFVLGPKSSRAIRAGKLTDLIWNGGKDRKGADYTEVSLVFDNSDRVIPMESDEVLLTRRVSLSTGVEGGYNSYFYVNGRKSQLQEFDSLLAHARISAEGYNIVQQGDVQKIISMGSVDRRRLLDNVAGLTKFDEDIAQAETKRTATEENLGRIQIILDEIKGQLGQLEKDRTGALKYKELKERLDLAKAQMAFKNKELVEEEINGTKKQLAKYEAERTKLQEQIIALEAELQKAAEGLAGAEAKIAERGGDEARQLKEKLDNLRVERARAADGIETSKEDILRLKKEAIDVGRDRGRVQKEMDALTKERKTVATQFSEAEEKLKEAESELNKLEGVASKSDSKVTAIQKEIVTLTKKTGELEQKVHDLVLESDRQKQEAERLESDISQLEQSRKSCELEVQDAEFQIKEIKSGTKDATKGVRKLQEEFYAKRKEEQELTKQAGELEAAIQTLTREYTRLKAEKDAVEFVQKGYTRAVSAILDVRDRGEIKGIHGTVAELAKVDDRYDTAISVAAGQRMQAVIVDSDAVAAQCIQHLRKEKSGRAIFLPLNKMLSSRPRGKALLAVKESVGFAIDLVKFDEKYRDAYSYVFGDTIVVETLDQARKLMGGIRLVTIEGDLVEASGAMVGGELEKSILRFGGPEKGQVESVSSKLRAATEEADRVRDSLQDLRRELVELESQLKDVGAKTQTTDVKVDALEAKRKEFAVRLKTVDDELKSKRERLEDVTATGERVKADLDKLSKELNVLKKELEEQKRLAMEATPQQISSKMKELMAEKASFQESYTTLKGRADTIDAQLRVLTDRKTELDERFGSLESQRKEHEKRVHNLGVSLEQFATELRALEKMEASMGKEMSDLQAKRDDLYRQKTGFEAEIDKVRHKIETKEDFHLGLQTELKVQEDKLAEAEKELQGFELKMEGKLPSMDDLRKTVSDTDTQMLALGNVNMKALEDYDIQQKRHGELSGELTQLNSQREDLIKLVAELTEKKKDGLARVFTAINENFKRVYTDLSGGGEAELLLENEQEPFQGGLLIRAKPPGKKVLRIEALSGGEKSLVSMAFIFALQEDDPSPFYIFDEIDQNLDAVNAEKVAKMLHRTSSKAQTIQVSLRKVTLKEADHIVGVTIQKSGVSEVVMKVNLSDIEEEKPAEAEVPA
jgi:chromosome segregation protein